MSNASDIFESDVSDVFLNTDEHAEAVVFLDENSVSRSVTAIVDRQPERIEKRGRHRLRIETVELDADDSTSGLAGVGDGWAADIDSDPSKAMFDFTEVVDRGVGMITARFERVTILETGTPSD